MKKHRNKLQRLALSAAIVAGPLVAAPFGADAAAPTVMNDEGAYVRLVGNPADGTAKFQFGWAASTPASDAAGYWVGLYDVTRSHYVWNHGASDGGGAGGNRTPVHQARRASDTTIPALVLTQHRRRVDHPVARVACRLSGMSLVFPNVSCLSRRHPPLLLPGCGGSAPCAIAGHDVSQLPEGSGGESELLVGNSFCCPV